MYVHGEQEQKSDMQAKTKNPAINNNSEILMIWGEFDTTNLCNTHWVLRSTSKNPFAYKLVILKIKKIIVQFAFQQLQFSLHLQ